MAESNAGRGRPPPRSLFISYRRTDAAGHAELFEQRAVRRYGRRRVFRDVRSITAGHDWRATIDAGLARTTALVAVIGPDYSTILRKRAAATTVDDDDMVVYELETARTATPRPLVIPLLVGGATTSVLDSVTEELAWLRPLEAIAVDAKSPEAAYRLTFASTDGSLGWWSRRLHRYGTIAVALALLSVAVAFVLFRHRPSIPLFDDRAEAVLFLPAVEAQPNGVRRATQLGTDLIDEVRRTLDPAAHGIEAPPPVDRSFALAGESPDSRAAVARSLLERSNADLLVTGTIVRAPNDTRFRPELYVGTILGAEDLVGVRIVLDDAVPGVDTDVATAPGELARLAAQIASALVPALDLLDGLAAYGRRDLEAASARLGAVLDASVLAGADAALAHHLRANALAELGRNADAAIEYGAALGLDPNFERSAIGLAETKLIAASGNCAGEVIDSNGLRGAEDAYLQLANAGREPTTRRKALIGLGRAAACRARAFADRPDLRTAQANAAYAYLDRALIDERSPPSADLTETLAVGYWFRASLGWDLRASAPPGAGLDAVAADLARVVERTARPWLKADAYTLLAALRDAQSMPELAKQARREACDAHRRTLSLRPGPAIESRTRTAIEDLRNQGVACVIT